MLGLLLVVLCRRRYSFNPPCPRLSLEARDLITSLLQKQPARRITMGVRARLAAAAAWQPVASRPPGMDSSVILRAE